MTTSEARIRLRCKNLPEKQHWSRVRQELAAQSPRGSAAGGSQVLACGIDATGNDGLARDAAKTGLPLHIETCDVTNPDQVRSVIATTVSRLGGIDIIVNAELPFIPLAPLSKPTSPPGTAA